MSKPKLVSVKQSSTSLEDSERRAKIFAAIGMPIVLALIGFFLNAELNRQNAIREREAINQRYVDLAIRVLQQPEPNRDADSGDERDNPLRAYAAKLLRTLSPVEVNEELEAELRSGRLSIPPEKPFEVDSYGSITGPDDRRLVTNIRKPPYPSICHIRFTVRLPNIQKDSVKAPTTPVYREFFATGFLVHSRLVIAQGYNVFSNYDNKDYEGYPESAEVFIGLSKSQHGGKGEGKYVERIVVKNQDHFLVPSDWKAGKDGKPRHLKYGGIVLAGRAIKDGDGIDVAVLSKEEIESATWRISSYPRNPPDGVGFPEICEADGRVAVHDTKFLNYRIDSGPASAGAPIWRWADRPIAIGIHTATGTDKGIRFTQDVKDQVDRWIEIATSTTAKSP